MHRFSNTCVSFAPIQISQTDAPLYTRHIPTLRREPKHAYYQRNTITLGTATVVSDKTRAVNKTEQVIIIMLGPGTVIRPKLIRGHRTVELIERDFEFTG